MPEIRVQSLGWKILEKEMADALQFLYTEKWTEEPDRLLD